MYLVDANILIYSADKSSTYYDDARAWLSGLMSSAQTVYLSWQSIFAFLRIVTNKKIFSSPMSSLEAKKYVDAWFSQNAVEIISPGKSYWNITGQLIKETKASGVLLMDLKLAALALEYRLTLCSNDDDFKIFPGLSLLNPL